MDLVIVIIVVTAAVFFSIRSFVKIFNEEDSCGCGSGCACSTKEKCDTQENCCAEFPIDKQNK